MRNFNKLTILLNIKQKKLQINGLFCTFAAKYK